MIRCPACDLDLPDTGPGHHSAAGRVRYLRCVCGLWLVTLNDKIIGTAGASDFSLASPA